MNTSAIWTKDFILNCIVCFVVNQSYYMTMVVIADYAATALRWQKRDWPAASLF